MDGELVETARWPTKFVKRRFCLFRQYDLPDRDHAVDVRLLNPAEEARAMPDDITIYGAGANAAD